MDSKKGSTRLPTELPDPPLQNNPNNYPTSLPSRANSIPADTHPPSTTSTLAPPPLTPNQETPDMHATNLVPSPHTTTNNHHDPLQSFPKPNSPQNNASSLFMQTTSLNPSPRDKPNTHETSPPTQTQSPQPTNKTNNTTTQQSSTIQLPTPTTANTSASQTSYNHAQAQYSNFPTENSTPTTLSDAIQETQHTLPQPRSHATQHTPTQNLPSDIHIISTKPVSTSSIMVGDGIAKPCTNVLHDSGQSGGHSTPPKPSRLSTDSHRGNDSSDDLLRSVQLDEHTHACHQHMVEPFPSILAPLPSHTLCRATILPTSPVSNPLDPRVHTHTPNTPTVSNEPLRTTNTLHFNESPTLKYRRSRNTNSSGNSSSHGRNERNANRASMARSMPHLRPQVAIQKTNIAQLSTRSDQVFDQAEANSQPRSRKVCSGDHTNSQGDASASNPGESSTGGAGHITTTTTSTH
ncbi:flocculation protein FLO11-like [Nicotiana tomentosiformis]|uniref:flocculation protein FLO11-like n=1 Tax=Nicotiana tomentosiformis TaxID=4098 RepID=UPI00388CEA17